jgi:hypothetical protein
LGKLQVLFELFLEGVALKLSKSGEKESFAKESRPFFLIIEKV